MHNYCKMLEQVIKGGLTPELAEHKRDTEDLLINAKDCLIDLSLNYNSVHFLDHSCFLELSGNHTEDIDDFFPTAGQVTLNQEVELAKPILNHPFILFKESFLVESLSFLEKPGCLKQGLELLSPFF